MSVLCRVVLCHTPPQLPATSSAVLCPSHLRGHPGVQGAVSPHRPPWASRPPAPVCTQPPRGRPPTPPHRGRVRARDAAAPRSTPRTRVQRHSTLLSPHRTPLRSTPPLAVLHEEMIPHSVSDAAKVTLLVMKLSANTFVSYCLLSS